MKSILMDEPQSNFKQRVLHLVGAIPKGKVVSYGQVAAASGSPRAARQVGGILRGLPSSTQLPWWRVVNNEGQISIKGNFGATKELQQALLEKDGVDVNEEGCMDMNKYRWKF